MNILITGGAGFIGRHIAARLAGQARVRVLDDLSSGSASNLAGLPVELIRGSILDRPLLRDALDGIDYVFHLAARISVPESVDHPDEYMEVNARGTLQVLEEAARAGVRKLVFSSSASVYGESPENPKHEAMRPEPLSPYAVTKVTGEHYCAVYAAQNRLRTVSLRYFNVFGPGQSTNGPYAAALPIFVERALAGRTITLHGDGEQTRDFVYVEDVAAANVHAALGDLDGIYNVAGGRSVSIADLARRILALTGSASRLEFAPERAGDIRDSLASIRRLRSSGFTPAWDFDDALGATIEGGRGGDALTSLHA